MVEIESHRYGPSRWDEQLFEDEMVLDQSAVMVLEDGEQESADVKAFIAYRYLDRELELLDIGTHPDCRRQGVGTALMQHLVDAGNAARAQKIYLEVHQGNDQAKSMYEQFGFQQSGIRPHYEDDDGEDILLMCLQLPN